MKLAFIADIHGSSIGLDAVLADIRARHAVEGYWLVGDYCSGGPDPVGVLERITKLPNARFIRGNADTRLINGGQLSPTLEEAKQRPELIPLLVNMHGALSWVVGAVANQNWLTWVANLPLEQRLRLPDGTKMLMVHASPGHDSGDALYPGLSDARLAELGAGCDDDLIVVGHTHIPCERRVGKHHWVNPGSVAMPMSGDPRACYAILNADKSGYEFTFYRVDYDREAVLAQARERRYPFVQDIEEYFAGIHKPDRPWY
ncbi:MAG TPA: metallophosphoesterase family protein [Spirillospora sp.]|jgi:putative phosphoesterase|nr:metallophosphoesterase family protein [Spirillospora sp.]